MRKGLFIEGYAAVRRDGPAHDSEYIDWSTFAPLLVDATFKADEDNRNMPRMEKYSPIVRIAKVTIQEIV